MKQVWMILGVAVLSAATGGAVALALQVNNESQIEYIEHEVERTPALGTHFTAYEEANYPDLTYAAENAVKAVVNIEAVQRVELPSRGQYGYDPFLEFFGIPQGYGRRGGGGEPRYQERKAGGSGVIISEDGYIVTNNHVVADASKLRVKLNDGRTYDAELVGRDSATDIALLKIDEKNLPTLPFGSSDALRLGEWVLAIGSPYNLQSTITAGIVSAKARDLGGVLSGDPSFSIESFIQTDAAVNPGNSGGALVNARGELVGINTLIQSQTGSYIGYSFAVPESIVKKVVVDLKQYGIVQRALLGIGFQVIDQNFIDHMGEETGIREIGGVYVGSVEEGGAASEAGIRKGDVITHIDGVAVNDAATLRERIARHSPNDQVKISVKRADKVKLFEVTLRNQAGKTELLTKTDVDAAESLGGKFAELSDQLRRQLDLRGGIQVVEVKGEGILSKARVKEGFIITHINDRAIYTLSDLRKLTGKITSIDGIYPNGRSASYVLVE